MKINNNKSSGNRFSVMVCELAGRFRVLPSAILSFFILCDSSAFAQQVTVSNAVINIPSGAIMSTGGGISIQNSGSIANKGSLKLMGDWINDGNGLTSESNGTVVFNGNDRQTIGGEFSTDFSNLDVTNNGGVSLEQDAIIQNQLTLNSHLVLNSNNLILGVNSPDVAGNFGADNGMVVCNGSGMMRKLYSSAGSYLFPLGEVYGKVEYSPLQIDFVSGDFSSDAYAEATVVNLKHPDNRSKRNWLNRYWNVNSSGITSFSSNVEGYYLMDDVVGSESSIANCLLNNERFDQHFGPWEKLSKPKGERKLIAREVTRLSSFTGVEDVDDFLAYPNPAVDNVTLSINAREISSFSIQMLDASGRVVLSKNESGVEGLNAYQLDLRHLPKGIYMLEVRSVRKSNENNSNVNNLATENSVWNTRLVLN